MMFSCLDFGHNSKRRKNKRFGSYKSCRLFPSQRATNPFDALETRSHRYGGLRIRLSQVFKKTVVNHLVTTGSPRPSRHKPGKGSALFVPADAWQIRGTRSLAPDHTQWQWIALTHAFVSRGISVVLALPEAGLIVSTSFRDCAPMWSGHRPLNHELSTID
jgi:hypothetical protein